jgi:hypothetical protein
LAQTFSKVQNLNLNGMNFDDHFDELIESLLTIPNLKSLYLNLEHEEQVDEVM